MATLSLQLRIPHWWPTGLGMKPPGLYRNQKMLPSKKCRKCCLQKKWLDGRDLCQLSHPFRDNHALSQASNRFETVPVDNLLTTTSRCWGRAWASPAQDREILEMKLTCLATACFLATGLNILRGCLPGLVELLRQRIAFDLQCVNHLLK